MTKTQKHEKKKKVIIKWQGNVMPNYNSKLTRN